MIHCLVTMVIGICNGMLFLNMVCVKLEFVSNFYQRKTSISSSLTLLMINSQSYVNNLQSNANGNAIKLPNGFASTALDSKYEQHNGYDRINSVWTETTNGMIINHNNDQLISAMVSILMIYIVIK